MSPRRLRRVGELIDYLDLNAGALKPQILDALGFSHHQFIDALRDARITLGESDRNIICDPRSNGYAVVTGDQPGVVDYAAVRNKSTGSQLRTFGAQLRAWQQSGDPETARTFRRLERSVRFALEELGDTA